MGLTTFADISDENNGTEFVVGVHTDTARLGALKQIITMDDFPAGDICLEFSSESDAVRFRGLVDDVKRRRTNSVFSRRTEESSANQYFQFYGYLSQQQNMMQDFVRTRWVFVFS